MKTIDVSTHGILPDGRTDAAPLVARMLAACGGDCRYVFAPGTYHFYPSDAATVSVSTSNSDQLDALRVGMLLRGLRNVAIDGQGASFVFHGFMSPFAAVESEDITLSDFSIDWEIPLVAEGEVVRAGEAAVDVRVDGALYPHAVREETLYFSGEDWEAAYRGAVAFDGASGYAVYRAGDRFRSKRQEALADGLIRFHGSFAPVPAPGQVLVLRHGDRFHPGGLIHDARRVTLRNVHLHNTNGLGILAQFSEDLTFEGVHFRPNHARGRRVLSGHDDGIHCSNVAGQITLDRCYFAGLMDDPLNVHGTSLRIEAMPDSTHIVASFVHPQAQGFPLWARPGDTLRLIHAASMAEAGRAAVADFALDGRTRCVITLAEPLPAGLMPGDALENLSNTAALTVRNSYFGSCRARGILASTPKPVRIERNVFASSGCAILLAGDANQWYESGACEDVEIRHNVFTEHCMTSAYQFCHGVISICPEIPAPERARPFHGRIVVEENVFHAFDAAVLYAFSVRELVFAQNQIVRSDAYEPWHPEQKMVMLRYCQQAEVVNNTLIGDVLSPGVCGEENGEIVTDLA